MKWFPFVVLLVTTVLQCIVSAKHTVDIPMFRMLNEGNLIETKEFMKYFNSPVSNRSFGYPYPNEMVFPRFGRPAHVIPNGCAWYSKLSDKTSCYAPACPDNKVEIFKGKTGQKTHYITSWLSRCPRQDGVNIPATFCCEPTVFRKEFTVSTYKKLIGFNEATEDCQWLGRIRMCGEARNNACPARKWRNEVARASEVYTLDARNETEQSPQFGEKCVRGNRVLCCKDTAFSLQQTIDKFLKSDIVYLFPVLLPKKHRYAGMNVKLIFSPGATPKTKDTKSTTKNKAATTLAPVITDDKKEDEKPVEGTVDNNPEPEVLEKEPTDHDNSEKETSDSEKDKKNSDLKPEGNEKTNPETQDKEKTAPENPEKEKTDTENEKDKTGKKPEEKKGPENEKPPKEKPVDNPDSETPVDNPEGAVPKESAAAST